MDSLGLSSEEISESNSNIIDTSNYEKSAKIIDSRINCSNRKTLNQVLNIAEKNIAEFSESLCSTSEKSQFVTRAMEVFKNNIQDSITVNGLPYAANKDCLSLVENKEQEQEATAALLATLAKKIEEVAQKRKNCPKEYCRILQMRLQMEKQKVKTAKIDHSLQLPPIKKASFQINSLNVQRMKNLKDNLESSQNDFIQALKELEKLKQNLSHVQQLFSKRTNQEILQDTGYNSS